MSELQFTCPSCGKPIHCDEQLHGQQVVCPICQNKAMVPSKTGGRLSVATMDPAKQVAPTTQVADFRGPAKKKSPLPGILKTVIPLLILAGAAYYVMTNPDLKARMLRLIGKGESEETPAATNAIPDAAALAATNAPPAPPPPPPVWSLTFNINEIPRTAVRGRVAGTDFTGDMAYFEGGSTLVFRQGTNPPPDREFVVYLKLRPGEKLEGRSWNVTAKDRTGIPQLAKRWKPNPRYGQSKTFYSTGYAMKLEFGNAKDGQLPGKIYAALPDPEKSFIAGTFTVTTNITSAVQATGQEAQPAAPTMTPEMRQRYGIK